MALNMYAASAPLFSRMLGNLLPILDKAEAYAKERKFDSGVFVTSRLAPDMNPLSFQIQSATDRSKFAVGRLTGKTWPSWPDEEKTLDDLRARIRSAIDYLATYSEADFVGTDEKLIPLKVRGEDVMQAGQEYLLNNVYPNFFFHVTTAYDILRHNGVPIGKRDFTG
jgi:uncharacterized protein